MQTSMSSMIAKSVYAKRWITQSGSEFQAVGRATEKARRPNLVRRCRATMSWWRLAQRSRWRLATLIVHLQQSTRYWGALSLTDEQSLQAWTGYADEHPASLSLSPLSPRLKIPMPMLTHIRYHGLVQVQWQ